MSSVLTSGLFIPVCVQGALVDHTRHLLPAGLAAGSGEVVPWQPRTQGFMVGVVVALEGSTGFKVCCKNDRR